MYQVGEGNLLQYHLMGDQEINNMSIDDLIRQSNWSSEIFRQVLISISTRNGFKNFSAAYCPEEIDLSFLKVGISQLSELTTETGVEHAVTYFADISRGSLVKSGRVTRGSSSNVRVDTVPEPGRERWQIPVMSAHVHPINDSSFLVAHGFSGEDFMYLLTNRTQKAMIMICQNRLFLVLKTSVTRVCTDNKSRENVIEEINDEVIQSQQRISSVTTPIEVMRELVRFNRELCVMFGLTLYIGDNENFVAKRSRVVV